MATHADLLAAGLSKRQIDFWCVRGYLRPDKASPGTGSPRSFSRTELTVAKTMLRLVAAGFSLDGAQLVARAETQPVELAPGITVTVQPVGVLAVVR